MSRPFSTIVSYFKNILLKMQSSIAKASLSLYNIRDKFFMQIFG